MLGRQGTPSTDEKGTESVSETPDTQGFFASVGRILCSLSASCFPLVQGQSNISCHDYYEDKVTNARYVALYEMTGKITTQGDS